MTKRRRVLWVLPICALLAACGHSGNGKEDSEETGGIPVDVVRLEARAATVQIERVGVLRGNAEVEVVPKVPGRIQEIRAVRGQQVRTGEILAVIEQGDYLDGLEQARAGLAVAEANRLQAELNVKRQRALSEDGITSDALLETAESAYQVALAGVDQAKAAVEMSGRRLEDTRIVSPFDGFVASRMVDVGTYVSPPVAAYNVVALNPMEIHVVVTDEDIGRIELGARADVTVGAIPDRRIAGRVSEVSVAADRMSGGFRVTVSVPNPDGRLRDGMAATVFINVGERPDAIVVSPDVLIERGGQWYAYVVRDSVAESRSVVPGELVSGGIIVETGLAAGEVLVVKGQAYLDSGTPVRMQEVGS